jgi:hypothetical protein
MWLLYDGSCWSHVLAKLADARQYVKSRTAFTGTLEIGRGLKVPGYHIFSLGGWNNVTHVLSAMPKFTWAA